MALYYLINSVRLGSVGQLWPGSVIDSDQQSVTEIESAGGVLVPTSNAAVVAAAPKAQAVRARGGDVIEALGIMLAAAATSVDTGNARSLLVDHADPSPVTLLPAASVARLVTGKATCSETLGGTTPASMAVGTAGTVGLLFSAAALAPSTGGGDSGDVTNATCVLPAGEALIVTVTPGTGGTPAGKITFDVTATPVP